MGTALKRNDHVKGKWKHIEKKEMTPWQKAIKRKNGETKRNNQLLMLHSKATQETNNKGEKPCLPIRKINNKNLIKNLIKT